MITLPDGQKAQIVETKETSASNPAPHKDDTYTVFLEMLRVLKQHRTSAPTEIPRSFLEQIQFYDDGANRRVYFYINKTWRYSTLT